jgi:hypothetical protein
MFYFWTECNLRSIVFQGKNEFSDRFGTWTEKQVSMQPEVEVDARPANYEKLATRITAQFPYLPRQLQRIARFALDAPEDFALGTAAQLAEQIGVQPSALVRFANAVGCDGFAELRQLFRCSGASLLPRAHRSPARQHQTSPGVFAPGRSGVGTLSMRRRVLARAVD